MTKQYRSPVMASIHETAEGLHAAGVMDKQTMRKFDDACLTPVHPLTPEEIRALREREGASQAVFARYLQRHDRPHQPMGARREASAGRLPQAPVARRQARARHGRVSQFTPPESSANAGRNRFITPFILRAGRQPLTLAFETAQ